MEGNEMFRLFFEVQYHNNKKDLNRIFPESVHDCSALHVCSFILSILHQGIFSVSAFIVSVIYLSRFKESSHITLHACTWRPLFLTSLLLADKMWEDKPVRNSSLAKLFPVLSNSELNRMESEFLGEIRFNVGVKPDLFCSFCEKLLAEQVHQEITRTVKDSDYAETLQADTEGAPVKSQKLVQQAPKEQFNSMNVVVDKGRKGQEVTRHTVGGPIDSHIHVEDVSRHANADHRYDQVPRTGKVAGWLDNTGTGNSGNGPIQPPQVTIPGPGDMGIVPRSQSAGPTTGAASRRNGTPGSQPLLVSLRGSNVAASVGNPNIGVAASGAGSVGRGPDIVPEGSNRSGPGGPPPGVHPPKTSSTPHPPRSVSVHPLHRTESQKKHPIGKVEDQANDKLTGPLPARPGHVHHGPPLRRSLPAKTSAGYAPLARAPSGGGSSSGISRMGGVDTGGSGHSAAGHGGSGPGSANTTASVSRQPPQSSPRSPGSVSPVLVPHDHTAVGHPHPQGLSRSSVGRSQGQPEPEPSRSSHGASRGQNDEAAHTPTSGHMQQQAGRSNSHPRVTSAPAGPGRYATGSAAAPGLGATGPRVATPPVPLSSGHLASHSGPPGQGGQPLNKAQPSSRGTSPGGLAGMGHQNSSGSSGQPTRASSAPRVSGLASHHHGHTATPPGSSSVRTAASQPAGQGPSGHQSRMPGHHVPGSPSLNNSPMAPVAHHYGSGASGGGTGASVVVFPASPAARGNSPSPALSMVGGTMPMKTGRGAVGSTGGLQRNASPMGTSLGSHGTMSPAGNMPMSGVSVSGQRSDLLSTTRGRSPPPGIAGGAPGATTARAPRAVTPGQIVKSIQQGTGNVQRNSFGGNGMVMHRGGLS
jgi:hypothetical protein